MLAFYLCRLFPDASSIKQIAGDTLSTTDLPNPRDTPLQYEAYKEGIDGQETPIITMAAVKHLVEVFDAWESGSKEGVGRKAVLTDLTGRTFEISCQLGDVSHTLDKRAKEESLRVYPPAAHEVFRAKPIAHYGLFRLQDIEYYQVPDAGHDFMPLKVAYLPRLRNIKTKKVLEYYDDTANWKPARFRKEFKASVTDWEKDSDLLSKVKETLKRVDLTRIRKVIIFGGHTMQSTYSKQQTFKQHGLAKLLAGFIKEHNGGQEVKLFAQDPVYGKQDKALLASEGFSILEDPRGVLEVDESCFVVEIGSHVIQKVVADVARPAGMIWWDMQGGHVATARTKKMAREYDAIRLPRDDEVNDESDGDDSDSDADSGDDADSVDAEYRLWLYTRKDIAKV